MARLRYSEGSQPIVQSFEGTLTILSGDHISDDDLASDVLYLLHQPGVALFELHMPSTPNHGSLSSGELVKVSGYLLNPDTIQVVSVTPVAVRSSIISSRSIDATTAATAAAEAAAAAAAAVAKAAGAAAALAQTGSTGTLAGSGADGPVKPALAAALAAQMTYTREVTDVPALFMILSICNLPAATTREALERTMFAGPGSDPVTLEGYFNECSRGKSGMNRANSLVVGPVHVPCSYTGTYRFNTTTCTYRDFWGWQTYAQQALVATTGLDLSKYRHRVAVLPERFTNAANCHWIGLGTLGPNERAADGSYVSSMAWIEGESAHDVMAYFHEMGHNLYLHHANDTHGCEYCDWSSVMGGCCAVRCHNAPHNWQLGWGGPLAVLTSATMPVGVFLFFNLPAQNAANADANIIWLQPDWTPQGRRDNAFPVSYYISYRIDSGKYDSDMPEKYLYATNVYWWDGAQQITVRQTRYVASVFTGQVFRSSHDGWLIKQLSHTVGGSRVGLCRYTEERETSCKDGVDNDCDGLTDKADPDCNEPSPPPSPPPKPPSPPKPRPPPFGTYPEEMGQGPAEPPESDRFGGEDWNPYSDSPVRPPHPASPPPPPPAPPFPPQPPPAPPPRPLPPPPKPPKASTKGQPATASSPPPSPAPPPPGPPPPSPSPPSPPSPAPPRPIKRSPPPTPSQPSPPSPKPPKNPKVPPPSPSPPSPKPPKNPKTSPPSPLPPSPSPLKKPMSPSPSPLPPPPSPSAQPKPMGARKPPPLAKSPSPPPPPQLPPLKQPPAAKIPPPNPQSPTPPSPASAGKKRPPPSPAPWPPSPSPPKKTRQKGRRLTFQLERDNLL